MPKPRHERAAQFAPFAALRGFEEAILERARVRHSHPALADDEIERISLVLSELSHGDSVRVTFFFADDLITREGVVRDVDSLCELLVIDSCKIPFSDIIDIELLR